MSLLKRPHTLVDIARELGLSHSTVSRALNDHPRIHADTKARVREAAALAGYVVNSSARSLRGEPSSLVGLVVPEIRNLFYTDVSRQVAETLVQSTLQLVLAVTSDDPAREYQQVRALAEARAAGVILVPSIAPMSETLRLLASMNVIQLFRRDRRLKADSLRLDDLDATWQATRHLIDLGHARIAYLGTEANRSTGAGRLKGFDKACRSAGLKIPDRHITLGPGDAAFGEHGMKTLFAGRHRPTAVVVGGVEQVLGCLAWVKRQGMSVPQDLSIVGFGDSPWFELVHGGMTTMRLPVAEVADAAARLVLERAASRESKPVELTFSSQLVVRGSTGAPPRSVLITRP